MARGLTVAAASRKNREQETYTTRYGAILAPFCPPKLRAAAASRLDVSRVQSECFSIFGGANEEAVDKVGRRVASVDTDTFTDSKIPKREVRGALRVNNRPLQYWS